MFQSPLQLPNFRWLWVGQTFIYCAGQFWFVALTWLVLQKTGSGIALSTVLMAAAIPRGILMLLGGAISDRLPSNTIAAIATAANTLLSGSLTLLLLTNTFHFHGIILISGLFRVWLNSAEWVTAPLSLTIPDIHLSLILLSIGGLS